MNEAESKALTKSLQGNIWKYALLMITNKRIYVAILGAYFLTIPDVTPKIIGSLLLAGNISSFIFEIPSGYVSDKIGHKQSLVISRLLMILSSLFFLLATNITYLFIGSIFLSASFAFLSGTGSAFMHETLRALKREHEYVKIMGKVSSIGFAVPIVLTVLVPFLVSINYQSPFIIALVIDIVGLLTVLSLTVPPVTPIQVEEISATNFKQVIKKGYELNYFSLALLSGLIGGVLFSFGGFRAAYQAFLGIPVIWYGVFFGAGRALASLMLIYSEKIKSMVTLPLFYRSQLIIYSILILVLGFVENWWLVVSVFIITNAIQWGLSEVDKGYQLSVIRNSRFKATLLSTSSQIQSLIAALIAFGLGFIIDKLSYQAGFLSLSVVFIVLSLPLYFYVVHQYKKGAYSIDQ